MRLAGTLKLGFAALASAACLACASAASTQESEWKFTAAFYTWLAGVDGTMAVFGAPPVDASASVSDVLKKLDAGLMGLGEARRGRFSVAGDVFWVRLSEDHDLPAPISSNVKLTTESWMVTAVAGYALVQQEAHTVDAITGARYWSVENSLRFNGGALDGSSARDRADWIDPLIGIKGSARLNSKFYFNGWALVGGFGAASDSMWDVMGAIGYSISDRFSVAAGYRVLGVDYKKNGFAYDVRQSGPLLSAVLRF